MHARRVLPWLSGVGHYSLSEGVAVGVTRQAVFEISSGHCKTIPFISRWGDAGCILAARAEIHDCQKVTNRSHLFKIFSFYSRQ